MVLEMTQPLTEMSVRDISLGLKAPRTDNLTTFMCRLLQNPECLNLLGPQKHLQASNRTASPLPLLSDMKDVSRRHDLPRRSRSFDVRGTKNDKKLEGSQCLLKYYGVL